MLSKTTKEAEERAKETPKKDLMNSALEHYKEAANSIHHFRSDIPAAIKHFYAIEQTGVKEKDREIERLKHSSKTWEKAAGWCDAQLKQKDADLKKLKEALEEIKKLCDKSLKEEYPVAEGVLSRIAGKALSKQPGE